METASSAMGRLTRDHYLMSDHSRRSDAVPTQQLFSLFKQSPQSWGLLFSCLTTRQGTGNRVWTELSYITGDELRDRNTEEVSRLTLLALYERLWATDFPAFKQLVRKQAHAQNSKMQSTIKLEARKNANTKPHSVPKHSEPIEPEAGNVQERQNTKPLNKIRDKSEKVVQPQKKAQPAEPEKAASKQKQLMFSQQEKKPHSKMQIQPEVRKQDSDSEEQYYRPKAPSARPKEQDLISLVSTVAEEEQHPIPPVASKDKIEEEDDESEEIALLARLMEQQKNSSPPKSVTPSPSVLPPRAPLPAKEMKPLPKIKGQATLSFMIKKAA